MITIRIEGASADEIQRGLVAAQAVFDRAGVTALQAAEARFAREGWDIGGFADPAPGDLDIADLWDEADQAAVAACCAGWPAEKVPKTADLELLYEPNPVEDVDDDRNDSD